jgi:hypothetical protein
VLGVAVVLASTAGTPSATATAAAHFSTASAASTSF